MSHPPATMQQFADELISMGVRRVHTLGWRDLADPDAGGSEVHADEFMRRWADVGLEVTHRTSGLAGVATVAHRNGYRVVSRGGRMTVFPRMAVSEVLRREGSFDALVEIWNGVPWMGPLWTRKPRMVFLHHIHGPMWDQILPGPFAALGRALETKFAPPFYKRSLVLTPSDATRDELLELGFHPQRVQAIPNGVDPSFSPGGTKSAEPLVIAVGRLAPVKRFELLIDAAIEARHTVPGLRLQIVGEGPERERLEARIAAAGAGEWITLLGRVDHVDLVDLYRTAWVVASASLAEGWGLSLTEAAACGTPAVASDIRGHRSSVVHGSTGVLAPVEELGQALARVLLDDGLRAQLATQAYERALTLTWDRVAHEMLAALVQVTTARRA
ncbi:MAG: glycosyltransferase family 4 protein [Actinomycetota bacterium]|nr:glycosyltransferase family 4 protein [Actinomycetota bacterium]